MTIVAAAGVAVNLAAAWVMAKANRRSLANIEGSFQHILTDLYAFIGTLIAGIVDPRHRVRPSGRDCLAPRGGADAPITSSLQRQAIRVLLEGAPEGMPPAEVGVAMAHGDHVKEVHDLHLWELAPGHPILTAHVLVAPSEDCHAVRRALERMLNSTSRSRTRHYRSITRTSKCCRFSGRSLAFDPFVTRPTRESPGDENGPNLIQAGSSSSPTQASEDSTAVRWR